MSLRSECCVCHSLADWCLYKVKESPDGVGRYPHPSPVFREWDG